MPPILRLIIKLLLAVVAFIFAVVPAATSDSIGGHFELTREAMGDRFDDPSHTFDEVTDKDVDLDLVGTEKQVHFAATFGMFTSSSGGVLSFPDCPTMKGVIVMMHLSVILGIISTSLGAIFTCICLCIDKLRILITVFEVFAVSGYLTAMVSVIIYFFVDLCDNGPPALSDLYHFQYAAYLLGVAFLVSLINLCVASKGDGSPKESSSATRYRRQSDEQPKPVNV